MRRLAPALVACCASACAPVFDVAIDWTIDGADAAGVCGALPDGTDIGFAISSRDNADPRLGAVTETTASAPCSDGTATIQTGPFADVAVTLKNGDVVLGSAGTVPVAPGSASNGGYVDESPRALADIVLLQGGVTATFTVAGRTCAEAGASAFTVSLFENTQPNVFVPVDGAVDIAVACDGTTATFSHQPINVGSPYVVRATTSIGGAEFATASNGEGFTARGPKSVVVVDLQSR